MKHFGKEIGKIENYSVIDCEPCGFAHLNPIPSKKYLKEFYEKKYYEEHKSKISEMNVSKQDAEKDFWKLEWGVRLDIIERLLPYHRIPIVPKLFDIGCGTGLFLECASNHGWSVMGLDPSSFAVKKLKEKGLNAIHGTIEDLVLEKFEKFDVVHLRFVLEHYPDPLELCRICESLLKEGGILCVEVPNDFSVLQRVASKFLEKKKWWLSTDHINYFSSKSLRKVVEKSGLKPVYEYTNFPMEFFLLMGLDYVNKPSVGRFAHKLRMEFERKLIEENNSERVALYEKLSGLGMGRSLILFAKKGGEKRKMNECKNCGHELIGSKEGLAGYLHLRLFGVYPMLKCFCGCTKPEPKGAEKGK